MNEDLTNDSVSADEFGRHSIQRFIQRPGVIQLDTVRGQARRDYRMISNRMPLLDHVQRYMPGEASGMYGKRQVMNFAQVVGANNSHQTTDMNPGSASLSTGAVKLPTGRQDMAGLSLSGSHVQRSMPASGAPANHSDPRALLQTASDQDEQERYRDVSGTIRTSITTTNAAVSASIIRRNLMTPMIMQKTQMSGTKMACSSDKNATISEREIRKGRSALMITKKSQDGQKIVSRTAEAGISRGEDLVGSTTASACSHAAAGSVATADSQTISVSSPSGLTGTTNKSREVLNTGNKGDVDLVSPKSLGSKILQRYTDMSLAKSVARSRNAGQFDRSSATITTAAPLLQRIAKSPASTDLQHVSSMPETYDDGSVHKAGLQAGNEISAVQQKAIRSIQPTVLSESKRNRNWSTQNVISKINQPDSAGQSKEYAGTRHCVRFDQSTPAMNVTNATSSARKVFRKQSRMASVSSL